MRILILTASLLASSLTLSAADSKTDVQDRLNSSTRVLQEIMATPEKGIPQDLLNKAKCAVIIPGLKKGAFIVGGQYGKGFALCRNANGVGWGAPAAVLVGGGSFGLQIGGQETDVVMLVMNQHGMDELMKSQFTLGVDASAAAGPVGRQTSAQTGGYLRAEILTWSRSRGLFAGISLSGASLKQDIDNNEALYGKRLENKQILMTNIKPPAMAKPLVLAMDKYSPRSASVGTAAREKK